MRGVVVRFGLTRVIIRILIRTHTIFISKIQLLWLTFKVIAGMALRGGGDFTGLSFGSIKLILISYISNSWRECIS